MARIKDTTVEAVKQAADFVAVVEERTPLRKAGARLAGRCPFHEERTPSFSVNPVDKLYYCFGCGKGGDMITFVRETQGARLRRRDRVARRPLPHPARVRGDARPGEDARAAPARAAATTLLDQAATFYERYLWDSQAGSLARDYLAGPRPRRGGLPRVPARARARRQRRSRARRSRRASRPRSCAAAGLDAASAAATTSSAGSSSRSPTRAAACVGFQARRLHEDDPLRGEVREHARVGALPQGLRSSTGSTRRAPRSRARTARASSRGTPT